jgi:hypothetical protein
MNVPRLWGIQHRKWKILLANIQNPRHDELHFQIQSHSSEKCRRVVNESIDANKLLEEHDHDPNMRTFDTIGSEAVHPVGAFEFDFV